MPAPEVLTVAEREARGKAARAQVPRSSHAEFTPAADRADPVASLRAEDLTRVPELVPIRYGRMLTSSFAFYRGCAVLMANDLGASPHSGLFAQLCGDAHLSNFGVFGAPDRRLIFDINDFDETHPGPWEWDVKRLAASFAIAARSMDIPLKQRQKIVTSCAMAYRWRMRELSQIGNLELWYTRMEVDSAFELLNKRTDAASIARLTKLSDKARSRDSMREFKKLTHVVDGKRRIISDPPLIVPIEEIDVIGDNGDHEAVHRLLEHLINEYRGTLLNDRRHLLEQYKLVHVARKVVGVGSVGTRVWILLMIGRDEGDPLFLQVKEAGPSVLEPILGPSEYEFAGQRVIAGQRLMQAAPDMLIGWQNVPGLDGVTREFYVRQLKDWKGSADTATMNLRMLELYGELCGRVLARAHARSGDRIAIASYLGKSDTFDRAIAAFAEKYADQNEADFAKLQAAEADGSLEVLHGL